MWFKNCQVFEFINGVEFTNDELEAHLVSNKFVACADNAHSSFGWVAPVGDDNSPLAHSVNGFIALCLKIEEKILPASVVNETLEEEIIKREQERGIKVIKKERDALKDELVYTLLPRAFTKSVKMYAYIDIKNGWLLVDTASANKADLFIENLRASLGSLKLKIPDLQEVSTLLTDWVVSNNYPVDFVISDACVLQDETEGGSIRCQRQNLLSDEIKALLDAGRSVSQLSMIWQDQVSFVLDYGFNIKSIKFLEVVQDRTKDVFADTAADKFDANFVIMASTLSEMVSCLLKLFAKLNLDDNITTKETNETELA